MVVEVIHSLIERGILTVGVFCVVTRDRVRVRALRAPIEIDSCVFSTPDGR